MIKSFTVVFFITVVSLTLQGQNYSSVVFDSINKYRLMSSDNSLSLSNRLYYAKRASELSLDTKVDSTILYSNRYLSFIYLLMDDYIPYKEINYENLKLATKLNDTSSLAVINNNLGYYHYQDSKTDSAYYYFSKALKLYSYLKNREDEYKMLLNIADIQETEKDYVGSEENAVKAIKIINTLPVNEDHLDDLWSLNNLIGIISLKLKSYDRAIKYHNKALVYSDKMNYGYYNRLYSINNLAEVYKRKGDFDISIKLYQNVVDKKNDYFEDDPSFYAIALANLAYTKSLIKERNLDEIRLMFYEAKNISESLDDELAKTGISIDLAKFYSSLNVKDSASYYAERSLKLSEDSNNNELLLESLLILSNLKNGDEGNRYLKRHIHLSDSLLNVERNARNKFALIEYETDEIISENEQISKERLIFLMSSVGLLVTLILLYIIISQRNRNKALRFNKMQQEANEEIYNLMLAQQDKVDEGRAQEKKRISEELHDGILGRLFGTRLSLDSLNVVKTDEAIKTRGQYISELKSIEQEIRKISHDLNTDFVVGSNFYDIIRSYIETQTLAYQLTYTYYEDDDIDWDDISNKTKIHVYRMLQETMQNIYKHANAQHIKISFRQKNSVILLAVEDDGSGFNTNKAKRGIGLKNFDSRARDIGGKVEIFSNKGQGTKVVIYIPI